MLMRDTVTYMGHEHQQLSNSSLTGSTSVGQTYDLTAEDRKVVVTVRVSGMKQFNFSIIIEYTAYCCIFYDCILYIVLYILFVNVAHVYWLFKSST